MPCRAAARYLWAACKSGIGQKQLHRSRASLRTARTGQHGGTAAMQHPWGGPGIRCSRLKWSPLRLHQPPQQRSPPGKTAGVSAHATHLVPRPWRALVQPPTHAACHPLLVECLHAPPAPAQRAAPPHHPRHNPHHQRACHREGDHPGGACGHKAHASGCALRVLRTSRPTRTPWMPHSPRACALRVPPPRPHATHERRWSSGTLARSAQARETAWSRAGSALSPRYSGCCT
jgi:hypothetical protein